MNVNLTPDLFARAIIAASKVYLTDPVGACEAKAGLPRRPLTAAALGVSRAAQVTEQRVRIILGLGLHTISTAKKGDCSTFWRAADAAERAAAEVLKVDVQDAAARRRQDQIAEVLRAQLRRVAPPTTEVAQTNVRRAAPGPVSSWLSPAPSRASLPPGNVPLRDRIVAQLRDAPSTAPSLAILTDAKELAVSETLQCMLREGVVLARPVPIQGQRYREWALAPLTEEGR